MDKFPTFEKLHGKSNFHSWKTMVLAYMDLTNLYKIVSGEEKDPALEKPAVNVNSKGYAEKCENWRYRHSLARAFILFNVDSEIVPQITCYHSAEGMWKALNDIFDRKNEYSLHALVKSVVGIKCESVGTISDHISKYNELWARLVERTAKKSDKDDLDSLEAALRPLAMSLKAKGSLFLTTLPEEIDNVIDNLKTKDNLTYDEVCSRLLELSVVNNANEENQAYVGHQKKTKFNKYQSLECSYCKNNKKWYKGHTYQNCRNRKKNNQQDKENNAQLSHDFDSDEDVAFPAFNLKTNNWKWIFDTGASSHMSGNKEAFKTLYPFKSSIRLGNDNIVNVTHIGEVHLQALLPSGQKITVTLNDVLYSPDLKCSLMSWEKIKAKGIILKGNKHEITLWKNNKIVGWVISENKQQVFQEYHRESAFVSVTEWHKRLGHTPVNTFDKIERAIADPQVLPKERPTIQCEACIQAKMIRTISKDEGNSCNRILEKIHSDVAGPFSTKSVGGKIYYVTFIDEYSRYTEVSFLSHKSEVENAIKEYILRMERQTGLKVSIFKSDNGGEYTSNSLKNFFKSSGIKIENSIPNIHETNGLAERLNRTLTTMTRTCLIDSKLPLSLWAEAVAYSVYTKNRIPHSFHKNTPFEMFFGRKPTISHLKCFGQKAFIHIPIEARASGSKFNPRSREALLVGYSEKEGWYRFYIGRKVIISRDYKFINNDEKMVITETLPHDSQVNSSCKIRDSRKIEEKKDEMNKDIEELMEETIEDNISKVSGNIFHLRRSDRPRKSPEYYEDCMYLATDEPVSYNEAISGPESHKWKLAIHDELESMKKNHVWDIVDQPSTSRVVGCRWIFKKKLSEKGEIIKYKARLVAQGFTQIPGIDFEETYSPVIRYDTIRILLAHCIHYGMIVKQLDIKTAFLNGDLDFKIYMKIPEGFDAEPGRVCCLKKSIYGLKQSPRQWNQKLINVLKEINLSQSQADPCMFVNKDASQIVAIYVDDLLVLGSTGKLVENVEDILRKHFEVTFLGIPNYLLSFQISWANDYVCLSQEQYISKMLTKFNLQNCKPALVPMDSGSKPQKAKEEDIRADKTLYQSKIGSLLYLALGTRPDITYAVNSLSQFSSDPTIAHMNMVQQIFRYLKGTANRKLMFERTSTPIIQMYSAYADSPDNRRSTSGYIGFYGKAAVTWTTKKQQSVAVSTTEAEYVALSLTCRQAIWITQILKDLNLTVKPMLLCDNQASIHISTNPVLHPRSKHIDVHYHFVRERFLNKDVDILYVSTKENVADIFTKPLRKEVFTYLATTFLVSSLRESIRSTAYDSL